MSRVVSVSLSLSLCLCWSVYSVHSPRSPPQSTNAYNSAYNSERLRKDALARQAMKDKMAADSEAPPGSTAGAWKWAIRRKIWDYMEENNIAQFPRPVHHRIPNFVHADQAAARLAEQNFFRNASTIKVNPDTPQKAVRRLVLENNKTLLTPQPRLRTGFFSILRKDTLPSTDPTTRKNEMRHAVSA